MNVFLFCFFTSLCLFNKCVRLTELKCTWSYIRVSLAVSPTAAQVDMVKVFSSVLDMLLDYRGR
jgi:hypothetical protein